MARRSSGLALMLIGTFLLLTGLLAIPGVGVYTLPTVSLTQGAVLTPTSQTGSWNTNVKCLATVTTLSNIFNGRYNSSTGGALPYGTGYGLLPNVPQTFSGIEQSNYKRVLPAPYTAGGNTAVYNMVNPPCSGPNWNGTATGPTFVELDNVAIDPTSRIEDNAAGGDCGTSFPSYDGGGSFGGTYCDEYTNLMGPEATIDCQVISPVPHICIHEEIDMAWKAAHYCGAGTVCNNSTFDALVALSRIDVQGFLYWDPQHLTQGHSWSGWELHPLTAWRVHTTAPTMSAQFTASPTTGVTGSPVTFSAGVAGGTAPYSYTWAFGDGGVINPQSSSTVTHTYTSPGSFTVSLGVFDSSTPQLSATATAIYTVVSPTQILTTSFTSSPANPQVGTSVTFTSTSSGGVSPYLASWNFGDGAVASGLIVSHSYSSAGTFTVVLSVSDGASPPHVATSSNALTVSQPAGVAPRPSFTWNPSIAMPQQLVSFTATVTGGTPPFTYSWDFGDGSAVVSQPSATHSYASPGTYSVKLSVTDSASLVGTATNSITVQAQINATVTTLGIPIWTLLVSGGLGLILLPAVTVGRRRG